jgi:periplasmic divalent cation tolerance protein
MFNNLRLIYITTKDEQEAKKIGKTLVEERLAACANIIGGVQSFFRWEGGVQEAEECILIAKTPYHNMAALTDRVKELHSYDCPCIVSLQITEQEGNKAFQKWLLKETKKKE